MTEDEAKTKACFRAATFGASQQLAEGPGPNCIGSACMAWRSRPQWRERSDRKWENEVPVDHPRGPNNQVREAGFCGLAGNP